VTSVLQSLQPVNIPLQLRAVVNINTTVISLPKTSLCKLSIICFFIIFIIVDAISFFFLHYAVETLKEVAIPSFLGMSAIQTTLK
jgi:hypothetical protein